MKTTCSLLATLSLLLPATATVIPLPITQENSTRALRVELDASPGKPGTPSFHYTIHSMDWEGQQKQTRHFCSTHRYAQGYASGGTLVLSNSGAMNEKLMSLAVVDSGRDSVLEHELLFNLAEHSIHGTAHWSGADEQGKPCGGSYTYTHWHGAPRHNNLHGWSCGEHSINLRLGARVPHACAISWHCDTSSGSTELYNGHQRVKDKPLPQRSRRLPLLPADNAEANMPAPLPADAPAEAAAVRAFIAGHPALLLGRLRYNGDLTKENGGRLELYVHPAVQAESYEFWLAMQDDSESKLAHMAESCGGGMLVLLRYWSENLRSHREPELAFLVGLNAGDILPLPGGTDSLQQLLDCLPELREDLPLRPEMQGSWDWD